MRKCYNYNMPIKQECTISLCIEYVRLCFDFRLLNQITERHTFPMPNFEEMLDALHRARFFSSINLESTYHQVKIDKESQQ